MCVMHLQDVGFIYVQNRGIKMTCLKGDTCEYPNCNCILSKEDKEYHEWDIWHTKKEYQLGSLVRAMGQMWECTKDHTSNIFGTDVLENKYWSEYEYE